MATTAWRTQRRRMPLRAFASCQSSRSGNLSRLCPATQLRRLLPRQTSSRSLACPAVTLAHKLRLLRVQTGRRSRKWRPVQLPTRLLRHSSRYCLTRCRCHIRKGRPVCWL